MSSLRGKRGAYTAEYRAWSHMRGRCLTKTDTKYPSYGGRGIEICLEWNSFETFLADMGQRPEGTTLGRKDNDGTYCKENCEWQTAKQQANNRRKKSLQKNSTTGITGLLFSKARNVWIAQAYTGGHNQKVLYRGKDFFEAVCALKSHEASLLRTDTVLT